MTTTFNLNGTDSTTIPGLIVTRVRRGFVGARRDEYMDVPGRSGFVLFAEQPGRKRLVLECDIQNATFDDRRAAVRALADLVDLPGLANIVVSDEPDRFYTVKLLTDPDPDEWLVRAGFPIEFAAEPYSQSLTPEQLLISSFPGVAANPGGVIAVPVVQVTATGNVDGYRLTFGDLVLEDTASIAPGETKTINSISYTVTDGTSTDTNLDGTFDPLALSMAGISGDFPLLLPGDNTVNAEVLAGGGSVALDIDFRVRSR